MNRPAKLLLDEIVDAIALVEQYVNGLAFGTFVDDIEKQDAVIRRLTIIGEAVKGLPEDLRSRYPGIPWRDIAGARDIIVHEYFRVDLDLAWKMVKEDLPSLGAQIRAVRSAEGFEGPA
jgi:uncharacterized protein with HEPN domain